MNRRQKTITTKTAVLVFTALLIGATNQQIVFLEAEPQIPPETNCIKFPTHYSTPGSDEFMNTYCGSAVGWPITVDSFKLDNENHTLAYEDYKIIYERFKKEVAPVDEPEVGVNKHCLAIMRKVYCSFYFPYCDEETGKANFGLCGSVCSLLRARCPTLTEVIKKVCSTGVRNKLCAFSGRLWAWMAGLVVFLGFFVF